MATGPAFPGFSNVFIPSTNADVDGRLIVGFSRNKDKFGLPKYCQYVKAPAPIAYYLKLTAQEAARIVNTQDFVWPDGQNRPQRNRDTESFNFLPFQTERYDFGFTLGHKTVDYASWSIKEQHAQIKAAQAMTHLTVRAWSVLTTAANWQQSADYDLGADHYSATATALGVGGSVYSGTSTDPRFKKACNIIAKQITLDTLAVVQGTTEELVFIVNPTTAASLSTSAEIHDYVKGSPFAQKEIAEGWGPNSKYGLPSNVHGYKVIVEPTVRVTTRASNTGTAVAPTRAFVVPDNALVAMSQVGGLEGVYGAPSFSTLTRFYLEEMTVETYDDPKNRLVEGHVVVDDVFKLTAPASGWYVADLSS